ncbi:MAG: hypothetical protein ACFFB5_00655 [Promethearchaeota archaeon]
MSKHIVGENKRLNLLLSLLSGTIGVLPLFLVYPTSKSQIGLKDIEYYIRIFVSGGETTNIGTDFFFTIFGYISYFLGIKEAGGYLELIFYIRLISVFCIFTIISRLIMSALSNEKIILRFSVLIFTTLGQFGAYIMFLYRIRLTSALAFYFIGLYLYMTSRKQEQTELKFMLRMALTIIVFIIAALTHEVVLMLVIYTGVAFTFYLSVGSRDHNFLKRIEIFFLIILIILPIILLFISNITIFKNYFFEFKQRNIFSLIYLISLIFIIMWSIASSLEEFKFCSWFKSNLPKNVYYTSVPSLFWSTFLLKAPINIKESLFYVILGCLWILFLFDIIDIEEKNFIHSKRNIMFIIILIVLIQSTSVLMQFWDFGARLGLERPLVKLHNQFNSVGNLFLGFLISYWLVFAKNPPTFSLDMKRTHHSIFTYFKIFRERHTKTIIFIILLLSSYGSFRFIVFQGKYSLDEEVTLNRTYLDEIANSALDILKDGNESDSSLWDMLLVNGYPLRRRIVALTGSWVCTPEKSEEIINDNAFFNNILAQIYNESLKIWVIYVTGLKYFRTFDLEKVVENSDIIYKIGENVRVLKLKGDIG